eukprot:1828916-Pyramimonas_sp.AAC.1
MRKKLGRIPNQIKDAPVVQWCCNTLSRPKPCRHTLVHFTAASVGSGSGVDGSVGGGMLLA